MVKALAVDHFIDALPEVQIRLKLREVGPSTLAEAEKTAVRMEANITADKQRTRFVGKVEQSDQNKVPQNQNTEQQMEKISKSIDMLSRSVQNLTQKQRSHTAWASCVVVSTSEEFNGQFMDVFNKNEHTQSRFWKGLHLS